MPGASSPSGRAGAGKRWCARGDLLTVAVAAMLCSATYCFSIWHNGRNAADKIVIGPAPFVVAGAALCRGDAVELDFEAQHTAERAGLSLSSSSPMVTGRRALRAAAMPMDSTGRRGLVLAGNSDGSSEAADGKEWARVNINGDSPAPVNTRRRRARVGWDHPPTTEPCYPPFLPVLAKT